MCEFTKAVDTNRCRLCLEVRPLCDSHILPEFFYERMGMYDEDHTYNIYTANPVKHTLQRRKGIYERLLCKECEERFSALESYAALVIFGDATGKIGFHHTPLPRWFLVEGIDYVRFKLFQMSLLWRVAVSSRPELGTINLGPHREILRKMLLDGNPGDPHEYGCIMAAMALPQGHEVLRKPLMPIRPIDKKLNGHQMYVGQFGGMLWSWLVSSHAASFGHPEFFLGADGTLRIVRLSEEVAESYKRWLRDFPV